MTFQERWAPKVEGLTRLLVSVPSVVGSAGEIDLARAIFDWLYQLPYFAAHPDHLRLIRTTDDAVERYCVVAVVRGQEAPEQGALSWLLFGHSDTVDVQDYGPLAPLAFDPAALATAGAVPEGYLGGRGALDMKSGLAAQLAVVERFASGEGPQDRCLLFAATPDEEDTSHGILTLVEKLPELSAEWGLHLWGAINSDYTAPCYPGDEHRYIYAGTIGKLLPYLYVAGSETHVGEPFGGFDPNWLTAAVTRKVNYNPDLCETVYGEVTPPPVALKLSDLKPFYTVQTALGAWAYFNWFTFVKSPAQVLEEFRTLVATSFAELHQEFTSSAARVGAMSGGRTRSLTWNPQVYTYEQLAQHVMAHHGPGYLQSVAEALLREGEYDLRLFCLKMTEALWQASGLNGPAAVVGFAQLYSPPVRMEAEAPFLKHVREVAQAVAAETGYELAVRHFFPYIADMSFLGCPDSEADLAVLYANHPGRGYLYKVDHAAHARLGLPVVNIGPWGEGAHSRHERVEVAYSCGVVPELIWRTCMEEG